MEEAEAIARSLRPQTLQQEMDVLASEQRVQEFIQTYRPFHALCVNHAVVPLLFRQLPGGAPCLD